MLQVRARVHNMIRWKYKNIFAKTRYTVHDFERNKIVTDASTTECVENIMSNIKTAVSVFFRTPPQ